MSTEDTQTPAPTFTALEFEAASRAVYLACELDVAKRLDAMLTYAASLARREAEHVEILFHARDLTKRHIVDTGLVQCEHCREMFTAPDHPADSDCYVREIEAAYRAAIKLPTEP